MKILLHPTYFPNIASFATMLQHEIVWEAVDNYQKQTFRNRCHICNDRGLHVLNIPISHVGGNQGRQKYKDVKVDNTYPWQRQHWRTLETAYRTSPFFEYYEDDLVSLFDKKQEFLMDLNLRTIETVCECLQIQMPTVKTLTYEVSPENYIDRRSLVNAKKTIDFEQSPYTQVFGDRHGFVENTSILDLLFNEGTNTLSYLQNQSLPSLNA